VPIIVVSAKSEEIDTVLLLEMGADDFVTKPYRLRELVARMRAVQRRRVTEEPKVDDTATVDAGGIRLEPETRRCYVRGDEVKLRRKEFELLHLLLANSGLVLTREVLIDRVWGSDYVGDTKTLDVHVKRLRALIEQDPKAPALITTVRGVGYRFDAPKPVASI
jgi:two-component system response regulator RegX3